MNAELRRQLLVAYTLTEFASLQEACWALTDDRDAARTAIALQLDIDRMAHSWSLACGQEIGAHERERVLDMIEDARAFITVHIRDLDELLTEIEENR